jgi:hypothetical protein
MSEMRELTDKELDAVCGGTVPIGPITIASYNWVKQTNNNYQKATAYGGWSFKGNGGNAIAFNVGGDQTNLSSIG